MLAVCHTQVILC